MEHLRPVSQHKRRWDGRRGLFGTEHEVKLEMEVWWTPGVFPRDEGPTGEAVTAVAYVCMSGKHRGHGWVWRHGMEGLWFLVSMNQQHHTASPTAPSLMSSQSVSNRSLFIATFCCMGRDNSLQYSTQWKIGFAWMKTKGDARRGFQFWNDVSLKIHHILILLLHFPTAINRLVAHGIMFSKRLMVLINGGLDWRKKIIH